ncbi:MAG: hypothetical protein KGZ63_14795 [Clostridiales bacterium]|jgi:uncharacterized membrane protein (DUF485 family)|nr:hypothetical protein [Clostridiales bacterium]
MADKKGPKEGATNSKVVIEVQQRDKVRKMEFESEEERLGWQKAYRKSKWYTPYFLLGVFFNYLLYRTGFNPANIGWGMLIGVGVPMATMFIFTELHYRLFIMKSVES